ncbi:MAG: hypothetical protein BMS9Abin02_0608 [Anaerolineae bacterium]|nr:MAG: hypothetical protein BMS9Abin02_0608 [Anaerolineae bacterium]
MAAQSLIGQSIGKYKIVETLGRGGMAEVYRAYQPNLDRYVAIKIMHSFLADEENFLTRFQREAKSMASLNHNNIVGVYDFDVQDGIYYIVMEFVSGGTLKGKLETLAGKGEKMPLSDSVRIILEIADALAYAHSRKMVHRDIKPGNIMIDEDGHAVLTDFGIAKILSGPSFTATGAMIGTPAYMSPEQGLGQAGDERSDLYALGVLFYQMSTGRLPYDADTPLAVILKHVNEPIPEPQVINEDLPPELSAVIVKAMAKDPAKRYQSAAEFATDLQNVAKTLDLDIGVGISFAYLADRTTPLPLSTNETVVKPAAAATVLGAAPSIPSPADSTRLATSGTIGKTEVARPIIPPRIEEKKRSPILWMILGAIILFLIIGGSIGGFLLIGGRSDPTPTVVAAVLPEDTDTPKPTDTPEPTKEPDATIDIGGTAVAAVAATLTAAPTETSLPTATILPTETATPDMTATFLAGCEQQIELISFHTYSNVRTSSAPIGATFPMNLVIKNSGSCPIEDELFLVFVEGEEFNQSGSISLNELAPGDEATLKFSLVAPNSAGRFDSTWQFKTSDGTPYGEPILFQVLTYVPATPTPVSTPTPELSPTPVRAFGYNWFVSGCVYEGLLWNCNFIVEPFGGIGPYSFVSDEDPPADFSGAGPFIHPILRPRCSAWVQSITVIDEGTGQTFRDPIFINPDNYFEGGCTQG